MSARAILASLAVAIAFAACGGGEARARTEAGYRALAAGEAEAARAHFDAALALLEPEDDEFLAVRVMSVRALAHLDAKVAVRSFEQLTEQVALEPSVYLAISIELVGCGSFVEAARVLQAGQRAHPEYPKWPDLIREVGERALESRDPEQIQPLRGIA